VYAQTPPADLVIEGVPPIPDSIQKVTDAYWKVSENFFMDWDPNSSGMLVSTQGPETRQLQLLPAPMGEAKLTTKFADNIALGGFTRRTGDRIVFAADHAGDEFYQLYGMDPISGQTQLLTDGDSRNSDVVFDHAGKQIAYLSMMPAARDDVLYVMDPHNPDSRRVILTPDDAGWLLEDWAHDGLHLLAIHLSYEGGFIWSINSSTGETTMLTKPKMDEHQPFYVMARYVPDDTGMYVIILGPKQKRYIDFLPLGDGRIGKVPENVAEADDIEVSPDGTWLAYLDGKEGSETLHIFNTHTGEELPKPPLEPSSFGPMRWNGPGTQLGFSYGSASEPFQAYSYDITSRQLVQWTKSDTSQLNLAQVKPEIIKVNSFDDREIAGYLYRPDPRKFPGKRPVLISIHGGPSAQFLPNYLGAYNYYLNELGVALLYPNVRGSTGYGYEFMNLDNGKKREDSVKDIGAFLDWIGTDSRLDSSRVGVQGGSYGGYMTLATLVHYGNRVRCGSDLMGITNFVTLLRHTKQFWQASARYEFGDERVPEMNTFLESISPANEATEIHDPVMITAGKNDPRVPQSESEQMVNALKAQNDIVWYIIGENEGHGFHNKADEAYRFAAESFFFQTYLLPEKRLTPLAPETQPSPAEPKPEAPTVRQTD
jgi:dipeptidyl aminopeptidase/acylaminoacyl peptidase